MPSASPPLIRSRWSCCSNAFCPQKRGEWPDIDLDLPSGDQRERIIQYVYTRYGAHGAAMTANVIAYWQQRRARTGQGAQPRARRRGSLAKMMAQFEFVDPDETIARNIREAGLDPDDRRYRQFAALWRDMQDLPRHLGQHSGGIVVRDGSTTSCLWRMRRCPDAWSCNGTDDAPTQASSRWICWGWA